MSLTETHTFEEGTDGSAVPSGANDVIAIGGSPKYAAAAAVHGSLGVLFTGANADTINYSAPSSGQRSGYLVIHSDAAASNTIIAGIRATSAYMCRIRANSANGKFEITNQASGVQATSSSSYTVGQTFRADVRWDYSAGSITVTLRLFLGANSEGDTPDETVGPVTFASASTPNRFTWGSSTAGWNVYGDTDRGYDDIATWPAAFAPPFSTITGSLAMAGAGTVAVAASGARTGVVLMAGAGTTQVGASVPVAGSIVHAWVGDPAVDGFVVVSRTSGCTSVRLAVSTSAAMTSPVFVAAQTPDSAGYVRHVASGLAAGGKFYWQLADTPAGGSEHLVGPVGQARTLHTVGAPVGSFKVAVGSCTANASTQPAALDDIRSWDPEFLVHLGDFHYRAETSTDPAAHRGRFENQITGGTAAAGLAQLLREVPVCYVNSDHEAGPDNGDSNNAYSSAFNSAFTQVVPARLVDTASPPRAKYRSWSVGRVGFFLLDIRNLDRSPGVNVDDASKTMLGATQKAALKAWLTDGLDAVKVILSDVPWMGAASTASTVQDKWPSYATERAEIGNYITANSVRVLFAHGDSHRIAVDDSHNTGSLGVGGFPVVCGSPFDQPGGGSETNGTWDAFFNNSGGPCSAYMRLTFTDDGTTITAAASGWDAAAATERVAQTYTWTVSGAGVVGMAGAGALGVAGGDTLPVTVSMAGAGALAVVIVGAIQDAAVSMAGAGALAVAAITGPFLEVLPEPDNRPPRVRLSAFGFRNATTLTVVRVDAAGNQAPVRAFSPGQLTGGADLDYDVEAPYNRPVTYVATPDVGTVVTSDPVTLPGTRPWFVHPGIPDLSQPLLVRSRSARTRGTNQGVHRPLGRADAIVISDGQRQSPDFQMVVRTVSDRDAQLLQQLLDDESPLLLQIAYPDTDRTVYQWVAVGEVTDEDVVPALNAGDESVDWTLPCTATGRPAGVLQAQRTLGDLAADFATLGDIDAAYATLRDVILDNRRA